MPKVPSFKDSGHCHKILDYTLNAECLLKNIFLYAKSKWCYFIFCGCVPLNVRWIKVFNVFTAVNGNNSENDYVGLCKSKFLNSYHLPWPGYCFCF